MAPRASTTGDWAGNHPNRSVEVAGMGRGVQRTAAMSRLDDDRRARDGCDQPVSLQEPPASRRATGTHFAGDDTACDNSSQKFVVSSRIQLVDAASENRYR